MAAPTLPPVRTADAVPADSDDVLQPVSPMSQLMGSARGTLDSVPDIYGVIQFKGKASLAFIMQNVLEPLVQKYPRLGMRIHFRPEDGTSYSQPLHDLPLDKMVSEHTLPGPDCDAALNEYVSKIMSRSLAPYGDLPPWDAHLLHYEADPHRTEFIMRADHIMGDGMAYNQMLYSVLEPLSPTAGGAAAADSAASGPIATSAEPGAAVDAAGAQAKVAGGSKAAAKKVPLAWILPRPLRMLQLAWNALTIFFSPWDAPTPIKAQGDEGGGPRGWAKVRLDLEEMKAVAAALPQRCTIHDLLVSIYAGGISRYLSSKGAKPPAHLRMTGFMNTRGMEPHPLTRHLFQGTNNFTFTLVRVPTGSALHPAVRTQLCSTALADLHASFAVALSIALPKLLRAILPTARKASAVAIIVDYICMKSTLVFSNVRGPPTPMAVAGLEVADMYGLIDPFAWGTLGLAFSYCGHVTITAPSWASRVPDPEHLLACVLEEYAALKESVLE